MAAVHYRAIVTKVCQNCTHPYIVTRLEKEGGGVREGSVTCSLKAWSGNTQPKVNQVVLLSNVEEFARGWRAGSAKPVRLGEKQG